MNYVAAIVCEDKSVNRLNFSMYDIMCDKRVYCPTRTLRVINGCIIALHVCFYIRNSESELILAVPYFSIKLFAKSLMPN